MSNKVVPENHEIAASRLKLVKRLRQIVNESEGYPIGRQGD